MGDIITDNLDLVRKIAGKIIQFEFDYDDLVSIGYIGLIKAARRYDPSKGASLRTYARYRIRGSMLDAVKKSIKEKRPESYKEIPSLVCKGNRLREVLDVFLKKLPDVQRKAIKDYFYKHMSLEEIGDKNGTGYSAVGQNKNIGLKNLRSLFKKHGVTSINDLIL